jgi:hypothetical protein
MVFLAIASGLSAVLAIQQRDVAQAEKQRANDIAAAAINSAQRATDVAKKGEAAAARVKVLKEVLREGHNGVGLGRPSADRVRNSRAAK